MDYRKKDRRSYSKVPDFPLLTNKGIVLRERRQLLDRRTRNVQPCWFKA